MIKQLNEQDTTCFFIQDIRKASSELFYINSVINSLRLSGEY